MLVILPIEVLKEVIACLLKNQVACALFDGWTRDAVHYVYLHGSFVHDEGGPEEEYIVVLLGVSHMASAEMVEEADLEEETQAEDEEREPHYSFQFNMATVSTHFENITSVYSQMFQSLFAATCWDNTEINLCAKLTGLHYHPCHNHNHALDIGKC